MSRVKRCTKWDLIRIDDIRKALNIRVLNERVTAKKEKLKRHVNRMGYERLPRENLNIMEVSWSITETVVFNRFIKRKSCDCIVEEEEEKLKKININFLLIIYSVLHSVKVGKETGNQTYDGVVFLPVMISFHIKMR